MNIYPIINKIYEIYFKNLTLCKLIPAVNKKKKNTAYDLKKCLGQFCLWQWALNKHMFWHFSN